MSDQIINKYNLMSDAMIRQTERISGTPGQGSQTVNGTHTTPETSFKDLFQETVASRGVSFSKHANMRTEQRNINLSGADMQKLNEACAKADQKGIKDALVVMKDSAFIVNTANKVVITVLDKTEMRENVFTNIDGALFI